MPATAESALKAQLMTSLLHSVTVDVLGDRGVDAGGLERLRQRLARAGGTDGEVAAAVMPDVAGPGHFAADIDHRRNNGVAGDRAQTRRIVDAVLQAEDRCLRPQAPGKRAAGFLGIGRLDAKQHEIRRGEGGCVGGGLSGQVSPEGLRVQQQAIGVDGVDMRLPADEGDVMSRLQQQSSIVASDGSRADDCDLHAFLPWLMRFEVADAERCRNSANSGCR